MALPVYTNPSRPNEVDDPQHRTDRLYGRNSISLVLRRNELASQASITVAFLSEYVRVVRRLDGRVVSMTRR